MNKEKEIDAIKKQIDALELDNFNLKSWFLTTDNYLKTIWGPNTDKSKQLFAIQDTMSARMFGCSEEDIINFKTQWKELLIGYIFELENLEKPKSVQIPTHGEIHLTVNQNQSQEQKQMIEIKFIIDIIKNELTGKQLNELKSIIQDAKIEKKNERITEKLISFGSNVASGILGNILSNPQLLGLL